MRGRARADLDGVTDVVAVDAFLLVEGIGGDGDGDDIARAEVGSGRAVDPGDVARAGVGLSGENDLAVRPEGAREIIRLRLGGLVAAGLGAGADKGAGEVTDLPSR